MSKSNYELDYEVALEILQNPVFDDEHLWLGAVMFVSEAFNRSIDTILEEIRPKEQDR